MSGSEFRKSVPVLEALASALSTIAEQKKKIAELTAERDNWERTAVSAEEQLIGAEANAKRIAELEAENNHANGVAVGMAVELNQTKQALTAERQRREKSDALVRPLKLAWERNADLDKGSRLRWLREALDSYHFEAAADYFAKHNPPTTPGATS